MKELLTLAFLCAAMPAFADSAAAGTPSTPASIQSLRPVDLLIMQTEDYLAFHPDQQFRLRGGEALRAGRLEEARVHFQRGARYADKLSQAALAEMWWEGRGGPQDRAIGYVWMDLAAERGTPHLLAMRERYWSQMDAAERARATSEGAALQAGYQDAIAKPRLAAQLRRGMSKMTGSRAGAAPRTEVCAGATASGGCAHWVDASDYYATHHWQPDAYWRMQEQLLRGLGEPTPQADVGPLEPAR